MIRVEGEGRMQVMFPTSRRLHATVAAALLVLGAPQVPAGPVDAGFRVDLRLLTGATCGTDTSIAPPRVVCNENGRTFEESPASLMATMRTDSLSLGGSGYAGSGIFTLYRRMRFGDREYLEMMVGW
jgi:hypothetical protein